MSKFPKGQYLSLFVLFKSMVLKKRGAKKSIKAKPKSALVIKAAAKKPKRMKEIILHEEWPQTEKLIKAEEKRGVLLEPERELVAKPEFEEITPEINSANGSKPGHLDPARFAKANARQAEQAWWVPAVAISSDYPVGCWCR